MTATEPTALLFPGQGSQVEGMRDLVAAHRPDLLATVESLVAADVFDSVEDSTAYAQPAIFCASLAAYEALGRPDAAAFAGHSLGELSALAAAGALDHDDALWLVVVRSAAMAKAGAEAGGGMLALLKATPLQARQFAERFGVTVANDNAPGQIVLAGDHAKLRQIATAAREEGLRAMQLDVAGAFHSPAMAAAAASFREALHEVEFRTPHAPVYSSCTAQPFEHVRTELANALTRPVQWRQTMKALDDRGITRYVDVGPGGVLAKLVTRNVEGATVVAAQEELAHVRA